MIDVTNCLKIQDENRGVNEKCWIDVGGRPALFKKTQIREDGTHTNAHYAEVFVSDLCKKVDFNCAETDIANRNGEIGCISYNFLQPGDELIDFASLIQNIRTTFDSKKMLDPETNERYSIPLILEALEEECTNTEEFDLAKQEFLKSCIIDSLIEHYDRNPSNIAIIKNKDGVHLSPMFDNGTSLSISVPSYVIEENIQEETWMNETRERNHSKIGVEGERCSNYDKLLDYILSNYYKEVKDLLDKINKELTPDVIQEMLDDEKYERLDSIHKELIMKKLPLNRQNLIEQSKKYEKKYQLEEIMRNDSDFVLENIRNGYIGENIEGIQNCNGLEQKNSYHIYDVDEYMANCIQNVNQVNELLDEYKFDIKISEEDKSLMQWAIMFNEMGKVETHEEKIQDGKVRDTFKNYSREGVKIADKEMQKLHFYETEKEKVQKLIVSHQYRELKSDSSIKRFIKEIGENNIDLYFAMKIAEANAKNPEIREKTIVELKELKEKVEHIEKNNNGQLIKKLPQGGKQLMMLGLKGEQIGLLQKEMAMYVRENKNMYSYYKARGHLEKYRKQLSKFATERAKEIKHAEKAKKLQSSVTESKNLDNSISEIKRNNGKGEQGNG